MLLSVSVNYNCCSDIWSEASLVARGWGAEPSVKQVSERVNSISDATNPVSARWRSLDCLIIPLHTVAAS